jgi:hypothetical protein
VGQGQERHRVKAADDSRREMMRRLRLGNLRKLLRARCGPTLPDDDAGREYLYELLLPVSVGPHAGIKMTNVIGVWAPWMQGHEAAEVLAHCCCTPIWRRMPTARLLGKRLRLTNGERERLKLWTIAPFNMSPQQARKQRRAKDRARKRRLRQLRGCKGRIEYEASSATRTKPWLAAGISRATWYRCRETSASAVRLRSAADALVSPEQAPPPKLLAIGAPCSDANSKSPPKPKKSRKRGRRAADAATARRDRRTHLSH